MTLLAVYSAPIFRSCRPAASGTNHDSDPLTFVFHEGASFDSTSGRLYRKAVTRSLMPGPTPVTSGHTALSVCLPAAKPAVARMELVSVLFQRTLPSRPVGWRRNRTFASPASDGAMPRKNGFTSSRQS